MPPEPPFAPGWTRFADAVLAAGVLARRRDDGESPEPPDGQRLEPAAAANLARKLVDTHRGKPARKGSPDLQRAGRELVGGAAAALQEALADPDDPLRRVAGNAALTPTETAVLAVLVAVELDPRRQQLVGYLNDDMTQRFCTPWTLRLLLGDGGAAGLGTEDPVLAVGPGAGLHRAALLQPSPPAPWAAAPLRLAPALLWWLLGDTSLDPDLPADLERLDVPGRGRLGLVTAWGADRIRRLQAVVAAVQATEFLLTAAPSGPTLDALVRRASLTGGCIVIETSDELAAEVRERIERCDHLSWAVTSEHAMPVRTLPHRPWLEVEVGPPLASGEEVRGVLGQDVHIGAAISAEHLDEAATASAALGGDVARAIRRIAAGQIEQLATRIVPSRGWDDLVLPPSRLELVQALVARAKHGSTVYEEWGFPAQPSVGVTALFAGPSGTGKTLAAEIVAGELGLDLYRIDLSQLVSKYIGETEKNLSAVFRAAQASPVVLFFDEADALLGKRSEVSDAHDRYANIEVAYLLQAIERHNGVTIMATNLAKNIDHAFLRRISVAVEFPMPEPPERLRIWERSLPKTAPTADLDLRFLADRFELSGGSIRNAALAAAFIAAAADEPITMAALSLAVKRELQKLVRRVRPEDFGPWADVVSSGE